MSNQAVNKPKLMLFAFQLRNKLALRDEPVENADALWDKCEEIGQKIHAPTLESLKQYLKTYNGKIGVPPGYKNPSGDYLELLEKQMLTFTAIPDKCNGELKGAIYPVQIHDTYAVEISLRYPQTNIELQKLSYLNFQGCLLPSQIKASLGQTLLLFVQPVDENYSDVKSFANDCLNQILLTVQEQEKLLVHLVGEGKFLGSPIFEYESNQDNLTKNIHILIWFNFPQTTSLEEKGDYYHPLINLLSCRHKILYSYSQARWCYQQARNLYEYLEKKVKKFSDLPSDPNEKLKYLKNWLEEIPQKAFEFANYIRDLKIHRNTIKTNKTNYEYWLGKLHDISLKDGDNLEVWDQFIKHTQDKFVAQINTDLKYLIPGQGLFGEMVATIRGIVEIEQAEQDRTTQDILRRKEEADKERDRTTQDILHQKEEADKERDRNFQTTAFSVASGLAVGGIVISASSQVTDKNPIRMPLSPSASPSPHPFILWVFGSIISGLVAARIAWWLTKCWQCWQKKSQLTSCTKKS